MKVLKSVQADFSESDPYLKAVGFSHDGGLVVTGGEDGTVRAWKVWGGYGLFGTRRLDYYMYQ